MPEMTFTVRWPDGAQESCYSPSLVVHDHLEVGERYPVADFVARTTTALTVASERVEARYGVPCTAAAGQLARIRTSAGKYAGGDVLVEQMEPARD